jgi:two-component system, OmpR family, sensor kinase
MSSSAGGLRGRLLVTVAALLATFLAVLTVGFNLVLDSRLDHDATDLARSRATSALQGLQVVDGHLKAPEAPDTANLDRPLWIFAGGRAIEQPRAALALQREATRLGASSGATADVADTRLASVPVNARGQRVGTIVAGVSLRPYERSADVALVGSIALAAILLAAGVLAARWLLGAGMRPVARMTAQAEDWSEHDLGRRFGLGPPRDDLSRLAATLDGLLDRVASSLRREQGLTAEISHELRTPLARLRARAQLARREPGLSPDQQAAWDAVVRGADDMARTLDALLAAARSQADRPGVSDAAAPAATAAEACGGLASERGLELRVEGPERPARVGASSELVERALHPLLENACRYGRHAVTVSVRRDDGAVVYLVEDDGPGVSDEDRDRIFEPAVRGSAAATGAVDGTGLGLPLGRRLARAAGGEVTALRGPGGRFELRLPAA